MEGRSLVGFMIRPYVSNDVSFSSFFSDALDQSTATMAVTLILERRVTLDHVPTNGLAPLFLVTQHLASRFALLGCY